MADVYAGTRLRSLFGRVGQLSDIRFAMAIAVPLFLLFLVTATRSLPYHIDAFTNVLTAYEVGAEGSFYLDEHDHLTSLEAHRNVAWVVDARDSVASQYPPGAALIAAPIYAVWPGEASPTVVRGSNDPEAGPFDVVLPPFLPAAIAASFAVSVSLGALGVVFRRFGGARAAVSGVAVAGLGTTAWSVASNQLWQHGPAMMWIALGLAFSAGSALAAGFAFGGAILTRPPTAVIAAATGLLMAWRERRFSIALRVGLGSLAGLAAVVAFNAWIFGEASISGGYGDGFNQNAVSGDALLFGKNVFLGLVSPTRGVLVWSPFLLLLMPGLRAAWKAAPGWVRGAALGGALYLLIQWKAGRYSGGGGYVGYRYPLEALTAAAPLLFLSYTEWVAKRPLAGRVFTWLAVLSVAAHGSAAVVT